MSDENQEQESIVGVTDNYIDKSKRKFSKVGVAAPVIMALANRPAWGNANTQCQISGFNSLTVVGNQVSGVTYNPNESCGARFDWATNQNRGSWPSPYIAVDRRSSGATFRVYSSGAHVDYLSLAAVATANPGKIFKVSGIFSSFTGNKTIYDAIRRASNPNATTNQIFLGDMLSLYLSNIAGGYTALSTTQIVAIYEAFQASGSSFEVKPGITWTSMDFDNYLAYLKSH